MTTDAAPRTPARRRASTPPSGMDINSQTAAGTAIQKEKAFKRGKAMSCAPMSSGTR